MPFGPLALARPCESPITPPTSCTCSPSRCPMPCGKNTPVTPCLERRLARQLGQADLVQHVAQDAMRRQVHLAVIAPRHDLVAQAQLGAR